MQVVPSGDHTVTATSGQTKVSGRKTNQTVEKTTRVTSSSLPRVKILPWVKIHPDPGGISNQSWILTLVGFATKLGEISFKNADAYVYTGLMLNAQNSFLPSTNEKLLFFPKHIQLVPKHCFLIFLFECEILAKSSVWGPVEWPQLCNWSPALSAQCV